MHLKQATKAKQPKSADSSRFQHLPSPVGQPTNLKAWGFNLSQTCMNIKEASVRILLIFQVPGVPTSAPASAPDWSFLVFIHFIHQPPPCSLYNS